MRLGAALLSAMMVCWGMLQLPPSPSMELVRLLKCPQKGLGHAPCWHRQKLHLLLPQQGPSFCECPLWNGAWHCAVWGGNSVVCKEELWIITFYIQSTWHVCWYNWLHMVLTTENWFFFFFSFNLCTSFYRPRLWGTNTQQLPCGQKRIFCYIQLMLHYSWSSSLIYALDFSSQEMHKYFWWRNDQS